MEVMDRFASKGKCVVHIGSVGYFTGDLFPQIWIYYIDVTTKNA